MPRPRFLRPSQPRSPTACHRLFPGGGIVLSIRFASKRESLAPTDDAKLHEELAELGSWLLNARGDASTGAAPSASHRHGPASSALGYGLRDMDGARRFLSLFEAGVQRGRPMHTRDTSSLVVRVCCSGSGSWQAEQLPRALHLFERAVSPAPPPPVVLTDAEAAAMRDHVPNGKRKRAVHALAWRPGGYEVSAGTDHGAAPDARYNCDGLLRCEHNDCRAIPCFGNAVDGFARACGAHRLPAERQVALSVCALRDLARSLHAVPRLLGRAAAVYLHLLQHSRSSQRPSTADLHLLKQLTVYFTACAASARLPAEALQLLPHVLELEGAESRMEHRRAMRWCLNALITACARAGDIGSALAAHRAGERAGFFADEVTFTTLISACGFAGHLLEAVEMYEQAKRRGFSTDAPLVCSVLHSYARVAAAKDTGSNAAEAAAAARAVYARAVADGLLPSEAVRNGLRAVLANAGEVDSVVETLDARSLSLLGTAAPDASQRALLRRDERVIALRALVHACLRSSQPARAFELLFSYGCMWVVAESPELAKLLLRAAAECRSPSRAHLVFRLATRRGRPPTTHMLNAMLRACTHADSPIAAAFQAVRRAEALGASADAETVTGLLRAAERASVKMPSASHAQRALAFAQERGLSLSSDGHNTLVHCFLAASASARRRGAAAQATWRQCLNFALLHYEAEKHDVVFLRKVRKRLLKECAAQHKVDAALQVLEDMEACGEKPEWATLNRLVHALHASGEVDDEAFQLWLEGGTPSLVTRAADRLHRP
mmetsp:Transcript_24569/g.57207  ORF Transcript_24569/g.57207 Transcript_24569/m.57207 type:complete len:780 (-) Transcript_24569:235-2574(-)